MDVNSNIEHEDMYGVGYLINHARNAILATIEQELAPLGVTAAQFIVVLGVARNRVSTPTEISRLLGCDRGAMTRLLDRIEDKGIIRRVRNEEDRRIVNIELTDKGEVLRPQIMASVRLVHARLLQQFSETEIGQFQGFLKKISSNANVKNFKHFSA